MSHKTKVLNHYRPVTLMRLIRESAYINLYHVSKSYEWCCASHELKSVQTYPKMEDFSFFRLRFFGTTIIHSLAVSLYISPHHQHIPYAKSKVLLSPTLGIKYSIGYSSPATSHTLTSLPRSTCIVTQRIGSCIHSSSISDTGFI